MPHSDNKTDTNSTSNHSITLNDNPSPEISQSDKSAATKIIPTENNNYQILLDNEDDNDDEYSGYESDSDFEIVIESDPENPSDNDDEDEFDELNFQTPANPQSYNSNMNSNANNNSNNNKNFNSSIDLKISSKTDDKQYSKIKDFFDKNSAKFSSIQFINEKNIVSEDKEESKESATSALSKEEVNVEDEDKNPLNKKETEYITLIKFNDKTQAEQAYLKLKPLLKSSYLEFNYNSISHPGNIYIRGLSKTTTQDDLFSYFKKFGELISCKILIKKNLSHSNNESAKSNENYSEEVYGFLNFKNHMDAVAVIKNCNGLKIFGNNELYLNHYISKKERFLKLNNGNASISNNNSNNHHYYNQHGAMNGVNVSHNYKILFCENIPLDYDINDLVSKFFKYGEIELSYFPVNVSSSNPIEESTGNDSGKTNLKGYGFIKFIRNKHALNALVNLNNLKLNNLSFLKISIVQQKHNYYLSLNLNPNDAKFKKLINFNDFQETNLYIKNLPNEIDSDEKLSKIFRKYGNIISSKIITNNEGQTKNYGFVCFEKIFMAIMAILKLNGKLINGKKISIFFAEKNYNNNNANKNFKKLLSSSNMHSHHPIPHPQHYPSQQLVASAQNPHQLNMNPPYMNGYQPFYFYNQMPPSKSKNYPPPPQVMPSNMINPAAASSPNFNYYAAAAAAVGYPQFNYIPQSANASRPNSAPTAANSSSGGNYYYDPTFIYYGATGESPYYNYAAPGVYGNDYTNRGVVGTDIPVDTVTDSAKEKVEETTENKKKS